MLTLRPAKTASQAPASSLKCIDTLKVVLGVASITTTFEIVKNLFDPKIPVLLSQILTVLFSACLVAIVTFTVRKKERQNRAALDSEIKAREGFQADFQRSEERNRMAMEAGKVGCWDRDLVTNEVVWSDTCRSLLGLAPGTPASFELFVNSIHPDDRQKVSSAIDKVIQEREDYSAEFRTVWPDRSVHWQAARGRAFYDNTGRPTRMTGILMDIDERKRAEERLHLQAAALEASANAIVITDQKGTILWTNPAFGDLTGYTTEEALGTNNRVLKSGKQSKEFYANLWQTISVGKTWRGELINRRKDGTLYAEEQTITPVRSDNGEITHFVAVKQDITERTRAAQELGEREDKLRLILESTAEALYSIDLEGRCTFCNSACLRLLGYKDADELLGKNMHDLVHHSRKDGTKLPVEECRIFRAFKIGQGSHVDDEVMWKADGTSFPVEYWSYPQRKGNDVVGSVVAFIDITERKAAAKQIRSLAYYDTLTGLPNRILLQDRLAQALARAGRHQDKVALLFLDLDRFKVINDSLGHSVGDLLLQEVSGRLKRQTREQDTVARLGGDEFLVVLSNVKQIEDCAITAERMMKALSNEFVIQGHSLNVSCSLGISVFPDDGKDSETLVKHADAAMYCAKEKGRNNFQFFTQDMNANIVQRLTLENSLRLALQRNEFFLMYQPQMEIATGKISGVEALIRWQHPKLGLVSPAEFIPIAEDSGLIVPIGDWVLRAACAQARKWQHEGLPAVPIAVNVSAVQFRQRGFLELVSRVLRETGLPPEYLELELTESLIQSNADVMPATLKELKAIGVKLSIDDFGTGYSSFSYLRRFQVHKLKIDRSFIKDVNVDPDEAAITSAVISMAKSLNLKVVAEGVENEEQLSFLRAHNCDEIQGYYFSKPLLAGECTVKIRNSRLDFATCDAGSDPMLAYAAGAPAAALKESLRH